MASPRVGRVYRDVLRVFSRCVLFGRTGPAEGHTPSRRGQPGWSPYDQVRHARVRSCPERRGSGDSLFGGHLTDTPKHHWYGAAALGGVILATGVLANASPAAAAQGDATVSLTVNGVTKPVTTSADTVSQLLSQQLVPYDSTDIVRPGLGAHIVNGLTVSWKPAIRVVVRKH